VGIFKHTSDFNFESIEDGFVCLYEDKVCFLNESAYEILMTCNERTTNEILQKLLASSHFSDKTVDEEAKTKDILEAIDTFVEKGLIKECAE